VKSHFDNVDLIIVRENTEDLYSGLEHEVVPGVVESLKIITSELPRESRDLPLNTRNATDARRFTPFTKQIS